MVETSKHQSPKTQYRSTSKTTFILGAFIIAISSTFLAFTIFRPNYPSTLTEFKTAIHDSPSFSFTTLLADLDKVIKMASAIPRQAPMVLPAVSKHTATVIFAHGLGDTAKGWSDAAGHWRSKPQLSGVKWILPTAPNIPISINHGMQMPGWFDIKSLGPDVKNLESGALNEDTQGILLSRTYFQSLIDQEISAGIPSERIILGGFSQGGAVSIFAGLTSPVKLGGIVGLSSWLLQSTGFKEHLPKENVNQGTSVFMGHGDVDPMVRYDLAVTTKELLGKMGYEVTLETYRGMGHSACLEELEKVASYLTSRLPAQ